MKAWVWVIVFVVVVGLTRLISQPSSQEQQMFLDQYHALVQQSNAQGREIVEIMASVKHPAEQARAQNEVLERFNRMISTYEEIMQLDSDSPDTLTIRTQIARVMADCINAVEAMKQGLIDENRDAFMAASAVFDRACGQAMREINN